MIFEISPSIVTAEDLRADAKLAEAADKEYALSQSGPRTAIPSSVAYMPFSHFVPREELLTLGNSLLSQSTPNSKPSDRILVDRLLADKNLGQIEWNFDVSNYSPFFKSLPGKKYATMLQMLQYPFSKGSIHIPPTAQKTGTKAAAADKPVIDPKYYEGIGGEVDFKMMVASQAYADKICSTPPLSDIIVQRVYPPSPSPSPSSHPTDGSEPEDFSSWVRDSTITDWHPVGTCAMGGGKKGKEDGYVVDSRLRVYGTKGLRVCDASVMPLQISAHLQASVYAIGEKGADIVAEDWGVGDRVRRIKAASSCT